MNNKKTKVDINILASLLISLTIFVIALTILIILEKNNTGNFKSIPDIVALTISVASLFFSISSWIYLIIDIRNSRKCKIKELKMGGQEIALKILALNPTKIVIIDGYAVRLFNEYVLKHLGGTFLSNQIVIIQKCDLFCSAPLKSVTTSKFVLDLSNLNVSQNDRIVFFEDVMFTGESIQSICDYLVTSYSLSKSHFYPIAFIVDQDAYVVHRCCSFYYKIDHLKADYSFPWRP